MELSRGERSCKKCQTRLRRWSDILKWTNQSEHTNVSLAGNVDRELLPVEPDEVTIHRGDEAVQDDGGRQANLVYVLRVVQIDLTELLADTVDLPVYPSILRESFNWIHSGPVFDQIPELFFQFDLKSENFLIIACFPRSCSIGVIE